MSANERQHGGDHYKGTGYEYWDFVKDAGLGYHDGNAGKYVYRWRKKGGAIDLQKAVHYLDKCMELGVQPTYSGMTTERAVERFVQTNGVPPEEATALTLICRGHHRQALTVVNRLLAEARSAGALLSE
jgi:hypothetical protein